MADGIKISELTESETIDDAQFFAVSDGVNTTKVAYSTIKNGLIDYSEELAEVISPTVTPTEIEGGVRLTITDIDGTKTADILNGSPNDKDYVRWFETVADMQAAIDLQAGMTCHTNGFHASGDGGAAYYTVDASGTANGMDVLALQGGLLATLVATVPYITPEMFGAWGDGTTDDTEKIQAALTVASETDGLKTIVFSAGKSYVCHSAQINGDYITIIGNGATIDHGESYGLRVINAHHHIAIHDLNFSGTFEVGSSNATNTSFLVSGVSTTATYESHDIAIYGCSFDCGVFGIAATNVKNLHVRDCYFTGGCYKPADSAGGYMILTQSCVNVTIENCHFELGNYGRHDIYVSVSQIKTENVESENVSIKNCVFDHSNLEKNGSGYFYGITTVCVAVRAITNLLVENCIAIKATGLIAINDTDGATKNCRVVNCEAREPTYIAGSIQASEVRQAVTKLGSSNSDSSLFVSGMVVSNPDTVGYLDASMSGGTIEYCNSTINYLIDVGNCVMCILHDLLVSTSTIRYTGSETLYGRFYNIRATATVYFGTTTGTGKFDINCFEKDLLGPWTITGTGVLSYSGRGAHVMATASTTGGVTTVVMTHMANRPASLDMPMPMSGTKLVIPNTSDSNLAANEVRFRQYNLSDGSQITGDSGLTFRFYL